jgi:hypothetical protein
MRVSHSARLCAGESEIRIPAFHSRVEVPWAAAKYIALTCNKEINCSDKESRNNNRHYDDAYFSMAHHHTKLKTSFYLLIIFTSKEQQPTFRRRQHIRAELCKYPPIRTNHDTTPPLINTHDSL